MKYKLQLFGKRLQIYAGFPQVWIFIFLVFAAVLFYYLSIKVCDEYYKSLFTNIFSGLLTGLVLSALSGSRQVYIAKQEKKYECQSALPNMQRVVLRTGLDQDHSFRAQSCHLFQQAKSFRPQSGQNPLHIRPECLCML